MGGYPEQAFYFGSAIDSWHTTRFPEAFQITLTVRSPSFTMRLLLTLETVREGLPPSFAPVGREVSEY